MYLETLNGPPKILQYFY